MVMDPNAVKVGDPVTYVDPRGVERPSLVTAVWPMEAQSMIRDCGANPGACFTGVNLLFISGDEARQDDYGRQVERATSVCHQSVQAAPGNYWK